jgi:hypothetical protein
VLLYQYLLDVVYVYDWPCWKKLGGEKFIPTIDEFKNRPNGETLCDNMGETPSP